MSHRRRQFFGCRLTSDVLFYRYPLDGPTPADIRRPADPVAATHTVLACPAAAVDRFDDSDGGGGGGGGGSDAVADSVARYLAEWYPTKAELKQHVKGHAAALMNAGADREEFAELQLLLSGVAGRFERWRFYRAANAELDCRAPGIGMVVMRRDCVPGGDHDDLPGGKLPAAVEGVTAATATTALWYLWGGGLQGMTDPRDVLHDEGAAKIIKKVGEGHPSEVYEASVGGACVAAKRLKDWKRTAGGSLCDGVDMFLLPVSVLCWSSRQPCAAARSVWRVGRPAHADGRAGPAGGWADGRVRGPPLAAHRAWCAY